MPLSIGGIKQFIESYRYAYPSARSRALKSFLLTEDYFNLIIEADDLRDALYVLRDTPYKAVVSGKADILSVEASLNINLTETLQKISEFLPGEAKTVFKLYLEKYEAENIKSVISGVKAKIPQKKTLGIIFPIYINLKKHHYEKMASSKTVEEAVSALNDTVYYPVLTSAVQEYERNRLFLTFDSYLDSFIYQRIFFTLSTATSANVMSLKKMIGIEIDVINILSVLRLKSSHVKPDDIVKYLIPRGYILNAKILRDLSNALDVEEVILKLQRTGYYKHLHTAHRRFEITQTEQRLQVLEKALETVLKETGKALEGDFPLGIGPVLGYVFLKTEEIKRLKALLKLKDEGFSKSEIIDVMGSYAAG
jgi:V/A-type H+-transporting ATPase subunit C